MRPPTASVVPTAGAVVRGGEPRGQAADVLLDEVDEADDFEEELDDVPAELLLPVVLLSEPLLVLAAGALLDDEPRLSVR